MAAGQVLEPAALPERTVVHAALLIDVAGLDGQSGTTTVAWDADAATWVRTRLPDGADRSAGLALSPDGTRVLERHLSGGGRVTLDVLRLETGEVQEAPVPDRFGDCELDDAAWAPDSVHLAVVWGCGRYAPSDIPEFAGGRIWQPYDTWVDEVDLAGGRSRVVEHALNVYPGETYPSYSPDGRRLIYGAGPLSGDAMSTLRVVALDGSGAVNVPGDLHLVYGDPWLTAGTALAWDESTDVGSDDSFTRVDASSGDHAPLGVPSLTNLSGVVGGRVVVQRTDWLDRANPCTVELCLLDPGTGSVSPWLDLPGSPRIGSVQVARALVSG
ncbi:hypothetical protein CELL_03443 [Cellulomonas sp. T2.31MG-18]|uniref:hypothetical protein n=1 Tax=Cellulomonas sp. T2.31MG-18 TaxID=3157619 RepID=UPI0035E6BDE2